MYLSLNFVKQYVKLPDLTSKELALALTMSTVEVEGVIDQAATFEGIVVGRVLEVVKHPQADRLTICRVDIKSEELQIICGGINVVKGMLVAVAKVGSRVQWHGKGEPIILEKAKIRGVESNGMIASSDEIGLGNLFPTKEEREILDLSPYRVKVGDALAHALGLTDTIFVIDNKSMTHRPDLWGQYGLAREVAAIYSIKLKPLKVVGIPNPESPILPLSVEVKDTDLCPRYAVIVLDGITVIESPWWLRRELDAAGVKPVNTIVDVTNYVMITLGQPLHAFDYHGIAGQKITIASAGQPIKYQVLNGKSYDIPAETLMIKDAKTSSAIAGIIGGINSHITDMTKTIVIEAANFKAASIRRSSMGLGLRTEASSRFEKKLDPELIPQALAMVVEMILKVSPGARVASKVIDINHADKAQSSIQLSKDFLDKRLGKPLDPKEVVSILRRLEFGVNFRRGVYTVTVPSFRSKDVTIPEDLVEEVARIYGYNTIEPQLPMITMAGPSRTVASLVERTVKNILTRGFGYAELYTYSFADSRWTETLELTRNRVAVANALNPELLHLRTSLLPGLLVRAVENVRWYPEFKFFELGRIFAKTPGEFPADTTGQTFLPSQPSILAGLAVGKGTESGTCYAAVKGEILQLFTQMNIAVQFKESSQYGFASACMEIRSHNAGIGHFGILKPETLGDDFKNKTVVWWELQFEQLVKYADFSKQYQALSKFPSISRDIAILVDAGIQWGAIEKSLQHISPLMKKIELFDVFTGAKLGENKKSIAFRMTFASDDRTLESTEVDVIIAKITRTLHERFGTVVR